MVSGGVEFDVLSILIVLFDCFTVSQRDTPLWFSAFGACEEQKGTNNEVESICFIELSMFHFL